MFPSPRPDGQNMTLANYQSFVLGRLKGGLDITGVGLGLSGEFGELMEATWLACLKATKVSDAIKKTVFHHREHYWENADEEAGDALWYLVAYCIRRGITMEDLMHRNVAKLMKRHPAEPTWGLVD
jgi:NTP pyrophosphatase (non-canonical NTP hydrolase)